MGWRRISRSLRSRGLVGSIDRACSVLQERLFDLYYGTDTVSFVELNALTIKSENIGQAAEYQPTRLRLVRRVLSSLDIQPGDSFVDFGCGKGRVLLAAADYGFRRITGVEFAKELCDVARENIARYRNKRNINADIRVVECDAVDYKIQDDENVFFMFNPFSAALVEKITKNIVRSLQLRNHRGVLIYNNPQWQNAVEGQGFVPLRVFADECVIYQRDAEKTAER